MFHEAFVFACNSALRAANSTNKLVAYFVHLCLRLARIFEGKSARSCTKKARERGVYHVLSRAVPLRYSLFDFLLQKFQGAFQSNNLHVVLYGIKSRRNSGVLFLLFFSFGPKTICTMSCTKMWRRRGIGLNAVGR